jgi:hypothetical protein
MMLIAVSVVLAALMAPTVVHAQLGRFSLNKLFNAKNMKEKEGMSGTTRGGTKFAVKNMAATNPGSSWLPGAGATDLGEFILPTMLAILLATFAIITSAADSSNDPSRKDGTVGTLL